MEYIIYHNKDLDGKSSAAIFYRNQIMYGENAKLFPYDYGEKLDTRLFKGKNTVMVDVSMDMERMELLSKSCLEFIWIDHHISAFEKFNNYCNEKNYKITERKINDLIKCYQVSEINLTYYYSNILAACEICSKLFSNNMNRMSLELISALGQYDTWRNTDKKKLFNDKIWETEVIPIQYALRSFSKVEDISKMITKINTGITNLKNIIDYGDYCYNYQKNISYDQCQLKYGEYIFEELKVIALNTLNHSSQSFDGFYFKELYDAMLVYSFNAKKNMWDFSLYSEKENVDILSIAKKYNGGGHEKACGFSIPFENLSIEKNEIKIINKLILDVEMIPKSFSCDLGGLMLMEKIYKIINEEEESKIEKDLIIKGTKQVQDHKEKWYYIPNILLNDFSKSVLELSITSTIQDEDVFLKKYMKYANENYQKNKPSNHWKK